MRNRALIIAHRGLAPGGASNTLPANTLAAFRQAIEVGADMVELDVRRTQDALVVFHDDRVGGVLLSSLTHAELVARSGSLVPTLAETLQLLRGWSGANIEIKEDGYLDEVVSIIRAHGEPERTIVSSFIDAVVERSKAVAPEMATGLVLGRRRSLWPLRFHVSELWPAQRLRRCGANYAMIHWLLATLGVLARVQAAGLPVIVWTVNNHRLRQSMADSRVYGVITDQANLAKELAR